MIRITQYLCPNRHAIMGVAYDETDKTIEEVKAMILAAIKEHKIENKCGICEKGPFHFEDGVTKFRTLEEGQKEFERMQIANLWSRKIIDDIKRANRN